MTRKDFELIAAAIKRNRDAASSPTNWFSTSYGDEIASVIDDLACDLAGELAKANPAFNQARFLRACGVEE